MRDDGYNNQAAITIREFSNAFQRIGDALGLEGRFMVHYGYLQLEEKAREVSARMQFAEFANVAMSGSAEWH